MSYLVPLTFKFCKNFNEFKDWLKAIPGVTAQWDGTALNPKTNKPKFVGWLVPRECKLMIEDKAQSLGIKASFGWELVAHPYTPFPQSKDLYEYQVQACEQAASARRWIFAFEMGLGKTACAIRCMENLHIKKALIVTPAIVRQAWLSELGKWWQNHPSAKAITEGRHRRGLSKKLQANRAEAYSAPFQIVSYALVEHVLAPLVDTSDYRDSDSHYDCIVLDEAHRLKNIKAKQSTVIREILKKNPKAAVFALTGTLMPNEPVDVFNILDLLWPNRFGNKFKFYSRYANEEIVTSEDGDKVYGRVWSGANRFYAKELRDRLEQLSSRVTKQEVAHLLPPFCVQMLTIEGSNEDKKQETFKDWEEAQSKLDSYGAAKIKPAAEWALDAAESASHCCVLTHRRETAQSIAEEIGRSCGTSSIRVAVITGEQTPEERNEELACCRQANRAIIVATMHSIGIGIDLTYCSQALFAELYYRPETVIQAIGRFSRLSGKVAGNVQIMCIQGTVDEVIANNLLNKISAINTVMKSGLSEDKLKEALEEPTVSIESFNKALEAFDGGAYGY